MSSGLPTPPTDDHKPIRPTKHGKPCNRGPKRTSAPLSHDHGGVIIDGRHKRVWKACERCRMKKTKCDGESPCKRCKDDGLVCTAGSRKKTEFKQLPRGYAEVLENTQYALIATVQKLYTMVRNHESWELGEPELNDRGLPIIHNIAEKLGCIRPSPDLPYAFPEDEQEFATLQNQLKMEGADDSDRKLSSESLFSVPSRGERASSSESDRSALSSKDAKDYNQVMWAQQQQLQNGLSQPFIPELNPQFEDESLFPGEFNPRASAPVIKDAISFDIQPVASPVYSDFQVQNESPIFRNNSPFSPWASVGDDFLAPDPVLNLTALYMRQQQAQGNFSKPIPRSAPIRMDTLGIESGLQESMRISSMAPESFMDSGCIRPGMLDCNTGNDLGDAMFIDYEPRFVS